MDLRRRESIIPINILNLFPQDKPLSVKEFYDISAENSQLPASSIGIRTITIESEFMAENILIKWQNGEATEASIIKIMDEYGAQQGGGQLYVIEPGDSVEEIDAWCFDPNRQVGDVEIIENANGFSICYISSLG